MPTPVAVTKAVAAMRSAENGALTRNAANEESLYTGSGRASQTQTKAKVKKKRIFIVGLILSIMVAGGAWLGSSNTLLGPMMSANLTTTVDWTNASYEVRIAKILATTMKNTEKTVTAPATEIPEKLRNNLEYYGATTGPKSLTTPDGTFINADNIEYEFYNSSNVRKTIMDGKQGRAANFYDEGANETLLRNGIDRNALRNFKQTGNSKTDMENFENTVRPKFDNESTSLYARADGDESYTYTVTDKSGQPVIGEDGKAVTATGIEHTTYRGEDNATTSSSNDIEISESRTRTMLSKVANNIGRIGSIGCAVMQMGTMVSAAVAANEIYTSIKYFMFIMENISKMMYGDGNESAYNSIMNMFSSPATSTISDFNNIQGSITSENSQPTIGTLTETKAPLEDPGLQMGISGASGNAATGKNYSLERVALALGGTLTMGRTATIACQGAEAVNSLVSIGVTLATAGTASIVGTVINQFLTIDTIKSIALGVIFGFLVPTLAKTFFTNFFDTTAGISVGAAIMKGSVATIANQIGKQNSGLTISDADTVIAFNKQNNTIIALDAELDRLSRSPFDITNRNTFLGSIAYSLLPTLTSSGAKTVTSLAGAAGKAVASLTGRAIAEGEGSSYVTTFGDCPLLESIGAVGDIYCNPITISDPDTVNLDPNDEQYVKVITENTNCSSEGCTIKDDSDLAKYISFCNERLSPYGITDQTILNASSKGNIILDKIPLVGDLLSLVNSTLAMENVDWATGLRCGNTKDNQAFWESTGKYLQRYVEDQRIYEQMGAFESNSSSGNNGKSPVTAYREKYAAEHPVDNSYAGYIARISGMTKEDAEDMLAFVEYFQYIDDYDATVRLAFDGAASTTKSSKDIVAETVEEQSPKITDSSLIDDENVMLLPKSQRIIYTDVRNRSYAI